MRMPSSLSSTSTLAGLSSPYFRAVSMGIIKVADNRPLKKVCVTFLNSFITWIKDLSNYFVLCYMYKRVAEETMRKCFDPDSRLVGYLKERLQLTKQMDELDAAQIEFPPEVDARDKSLRTKKVRVLNDIVFQAMADVTFFFEAIALHPELKERLDSDVKDLLGVKHNSSQDYGFMILNLLQSILIVNHDKKGKIERDDFRLQLNNKLQGIIMDKARQFLPIVFKNDKAEHIVWDDLARAWAWTAMLAINRDYGVPNRTFDFDTANLLK
jgi:hypothetical protein